MPIFYYFSVKGKSAKNSHFLHFETLELEYEFSRKVTKPNLVFGTTFILWHLSKYALKMPENEPLKVKIFILSILEGFLKKIQKTSLDFNYVKPCLVM